MIENIRGPCKEQYSWPQEARARTTPAEVLRENSLHQELKAKSSWSEDSTAHAVWREVAIRRTGSSPSKEKVEVSECKETAILSLQDAYLKHVSSSNLGFLSGGYDVILILELGTGRLLTQLQLLNSHTVFHPQNQKSGLNTSPPWLCHRGSVFPTLCRQEPHRRWVYLPMWITHFLKLSQPDSPKGRTVGRHWNYIATDNAPWICVSHDWQALPTGWRAELFMWKVNHVPWKLCDHQVPHEPIFRSYYGLREWTTHMVAPPLYAFYFQSINSDCLGYLPIFLFCF